jgi:hypothetical protein
MSSWIASAPSPIIAVIGLDGAVFSRQGILYPSWQGDCIHDIEKKEQCTSEDALKGFSMQAHFLISFF